MKSPNMIGRNPIEMVHFRPMKSAMNPDPTLPIRPVKVAIEKTKPICHGSRKPSRKIPNSHFQSAVAN